MIDRSACPAVKHGTAAAYWKGSCVCDDARDASRRYRKRRLAGLPVIGLADEGVDATGTRRRLRALAAIGWPLTDLWNRMGGKGRMGPLLYGGPRVLRSSAERVKRLYDELWDVPGPSKHTRSRALARGWPPPQAWDDDTIDDPAASAYGAGYRPRPRFQIYSDARDEGMSIEDARRAAGVSRKTAERYEYRRREAA